MFTELYSYHHYIILEHIKTPTPRNPVAISSIHPILPSPWSLEKPLIYFCLYGFADSEHSYSGIRQRVVCCDWLFSLRMFSKFILGVSILHSFLRQLIEYVGLEFENKAGKFSGLFFSFA